MLGNAEASKRELLVRWLEYCSRLIYLGGYHDTGTNF